MTEQAEREIRREIMRLNTKFEWALSAGNAELAESYHGAIVGLRTLLGDTTDSGDIK